MNTLVRRTTTVLAVTLAIIIGALSIEAAAAAVRASAPPAGPAVTVQSIQAELELERARSKSLQEQLQRLTIQSTTLTQSMTAADTQIAADAVAAEKMRSDLAEAKAQLAKLQKRMAAAARAAQRTRIRTVVRVVTRTRGGGEVEDDD